MVRSTLTGSRIRERRTVIGLRQAALAKNVGISPSYLNLIEHNRRRIGGKLLIDIARALGVEPAALIEGAESSLLEGLRDAATGHQGAMQELNRIEEFVGRFPGWAALLAERHQQQAGLERTVEMLSDRLTHDPFLPGSIHELLSTITAIRSSAAILVETEDIGADWQKRFQRNILDESQRLVDGAQALVAYLDDSSGDRSLRATPREEFDAFLRRVDFHIAPLEGPHPEPVEDYVAGREELTSEPARAMACDFLRRYRRDAENIPLAAFATALNRVGMDPAALAGQFQCDLLTVFRRLASLPLDIADQEIGLVICDASGTLTYRKPVPGFSLPRFGATCPRWPLYDALARPMVPIRTRIALRARSLQTYDAFAICQPEGQPTFDRPTVMEAGMLIVPSTGAPAADGSARPVGASCRICSEQDCPARREPSILGDAF